MIMHAHKHHVIQAKLHIPKPPRHAVRRPRLEQQLDRMTDYKITVIQGGAATGKTTLLASYIRSRPDVKAHWLTIDSFDNDVRLLWTYIIEAFRAELGQRADALHQLLASSIQNSDVYSVMAEVINTVQPEQPVLVVLDDVHHVTDTEAIETVQYFLRYSAPCVRVVLLTRSQLRIPIDEWHMAGDVLQLDNEALYATEDEARQFLTTACGLQLSEPAMQQLIALADGWLGGLQLLSTAFTHNKRAAARDQALNEHVVQYLTNEIFHALCEAERHVLLAVSTVTYFDAAICAAITDDAQAPDVLQRLIDRQVFIVVVDERQGLYRYHPLFQRFLQQQFALLPPAVQQTMHARAASYYEQRGDAVQSVEHYVQATMYDKAFAVIASVHSGVKSWRLLRLMPLHALEGRVDEVFQRFFSHFVEHETEQCVRMIERFGGSFTNPLANRLFALFASLVRDEPFHPDTTDWSVANLRTLPLEDETKAIVYSFVALVLSSHHKEREMLLCLQEADRLLTRVNNAYVRFYCWEMKSQVKEHMGDLQQCVAIYDAMFRLVQQHEFLQPIAVTAHIGIVGVLLKRGQLSKARSHLHTIQQQEHFQPSVQVAYIYNELEYHVLRGDHNAARQCAQRMVERGLLHHPLYRSLLLRYMLLLDMADAEHVAYFQYDAIASPHWQDDLLHIRLLAREGLFDRALAVTHDRLRRARQLQAKLPLVETLLVKIHVLSEQTPSHWKKPAASALREAVYYSAANRMISPFLLTEASIEQLLSTLLGDERAQLKEEERQFIADVLAHKKKQQLNETKDATEQAAGRTLSKRETEVLHVLAQGATNKHIAETLHISVATVKTHIVNMYEKLGVNNRVEAVQKAKTLGILPSAKQ